MPRATRCYHETVERTERIRAYIGIGSNLGDRRAALERAVLLLGELGTVAIRSSILETAPWGYEYQPDFLNMVVALDTALSAVELHHAMLRIEKRMGRVKTFRNGPRSIDLDLLLYGEETIATPELTVPHPRMAERDFVMLPLREIAPDAADRIARACPEDPDAKIPL